MDVVDYEIERCETCGADYVPTFRHHTCRQIPKECLGPGATHHMACACREQYVARLENELAELKLLVGVTHE